MSIRNLLLTGGPSHEFATTSTLLVDLLADAAYESTVVDSPRSVFGALRECAAGRAGCYDVITVYGLHWRREQAQYADRRDELAFALSDDDAEVLREFVVAGGGLLALHTAVICFDAHPVWRDLCGAAWDWERSSHPPVGDLSVAVTPAGGGHEVTVGTDDFVVEDELYAGLDMSADVEPLLVATQDGLTAPVLWARDFGNGRVVTDLLGHGPASLRAPAHRVTLRRAAEWVAPRSR